MAAGQQKKRLISNSLPEHYKEKKKKRLKSSEYALNLRTQPYLEMNGNQETTLAKREQIGIALKDMGPYIDSTRIHRSGLADVISVPKEIYDLDILRDVLSYEVWSTCLSDSDRNLLTQFLPTGMDTEHVVQSLLSGENHHFGNPSSIWTSLLCSGSLHPDAVLQKELQIKFNKKQYYPELHKYHTNMIERLKILKAQWKSSKESEMSKELIKPKARSLSASSTKVKEPPQKVQIRAVDTSKYMSYIKITKKQHEAIKSNLRSSGDAIQSKSISRVLGDIKNFPVHPYEELEREDKRLLHERWLQVVSKDLPVAFEEHKGKILKREELMKCLEQELSEKQTLILDKDLPVLFEEHTENALKSEELMKCLEQEISEKQTLIPEKADDVCKMELSPQETTREEELDDQNPGDVLIPNIAISASFNSDMGLITIDKQSSTQNTLIPEEICPLVNLKENLLDCPIEPNTSTSPPKSMWQAVDNPFIPSSNFSLTTKLEQTEEHQANIFNMENNVSQFDNTPIFPPYNNQRVSPHLSPYPKAPEMLLSYPQDNINHHIRQPKMQFVAGNGSVPLFNEQQSSNKRQLYLNRSMTGITQFPNQQQNQKTSMFPNRGYPNDKLINQNWYPNNHRVSNSNSNSDSNNNANFWSGVGTSSVNNPDGSLYSVLSSCGNIPSQLQSSNLMNTEPLIVPNENYGFIPQFGNLSSHEGVSNSSTIATLPSPWINYQAQQNSNMQDSTGKPFVRPWNQ